MPIGTTRKTPDRGRAEGWQARVAALLAHWRDRSLPTKSPLIIAGIPCCSRCGMALRHEMDLGDGSCLHCYWQDAAL